MGKLLGKRAAEPVDVGGQVGCAACAWNLHDGIGGGSLAGRHKKRLVDASANTGRAHLVHIPNSRVESDARDGLAAELIAQVYQHI